MKCPNCGAQLPDGTLFCTECGASVESNGNSPESQTPEPAVAATPEPQPAEQPAQQMPVQQAAPTQQIPQQPTASQAVPPVPPIPPQQGLSTGMKVLWAVVGAFTGLIGVLIAYLVNKNSGDKAKSDGLKFSLIGMAIGVALTFILAFAGAACTASVLNNAAQSGSTTTTTTTTTTKPSTNSGSASSSSSSSAASGSASAGAATANSAYFDSHNGLTVAGAVNLSGAEIVSQLEALDFKYSDIYEGWLSEDYSRTFDVEDVDSNWLTRDAVLKIAAGAPNGDVTFLITDDTNYASMAEATNALVNVTRVDTKTIDDSTQFEIVTNNAGQRFLLMESFSGHEIDIHIVPESFIKSGAFNTYMGLDENYPTDLDEIWKTVTTSGTSA